MPLYDFECEDCTQNFEELCDYEEISHVICPICGSSEIKKLLSNIKLAFSNPRESSKSDNFGYMAAYNMEKAKEFRRHAEKKSHVGTMPYSPLNDAEKFGEGVFHKGEDF